MIAVTDSSRPGRALANMPCSSLIDRLRVRIAFSSLTRAVLGMIALIFFVNVFVLRNAVPTHTKALVIASSSATTGDSTWLKRIPANWAIYHYTLDRLRDPSLLAVPVNKGNEAMVYLTYIIDHYDALPDVVFFRHDHDDAWHQQGFDAVFEVTRLRSGYVVEHGYVSPRCLSGCENIIPVNAEEYVELTQLHLAPRDTQLRSLFMEFLDAGENEAIPSRIAAPCCGQFAVSRRQIRGRSLEWWTRLRQWLASTELNSYESGRLMEYTWHIWFGQGAQMCSRSREECMCNVFGYGAGCKVT